MSPGYGYACIVIALLAALHPLGVIAASVFVAGVLVGAGIGGLPSIEETTLLLRDKGPRKISPFFIPG